MFAYCNNNPVVLADSTGTASEVCIKANSDERLFPKAVGMGGSTNINGGNFDPNPKPIQTEKSSGIVEFLTNTDEQVVLEAEFFAFYHGVPVFKANLGNGGAFSFYIIVLDDYYIYDGKGIATLKHEYGHRLHLNDIGFVAYTFTTAIPSLIGAGLSSRISWINENYFSLPWEYVADMYGGAQRTGYCPWADDAAIAFWLYTILSSQATGGV